MDWASNCRKISKLLQWFGQSIDSNMNFGAKSTAAPPERLRGLAACFLGVNRAHWWNLSPHNRYLGLRQSAGASVPKCPDHTKAQTICTHRSISLMRVVKVTFGHCSGASNPPFQRSGDSRLHSRCMHAGRFSKVTAFLAPVPH
jgi:hypothetical protein